MAVVELAVTLPVLVLIALGAMQASHMTHLRHAGLIIADEVARAAVQDDLSDRQLRKMAESLAADVKLQDVSFGIGRRVRTSTLTVEARIPVAANYSGPIVVPAGVLRIERSVYKEHP